MASYREQAAAAIADVNRREVEEEFGENPCDRSTFINPEEQVMFNTFCNSPRCDDCGPRKVRHLLNQLESMGTLYIVPINKDYQKIIGRIRKQRQRKGISYQYISWTLEGQRWLVTDAPISDNVTVLGKIKATIKNLYLQGRGQIRKSINPLYSVNLRSRLRRSQQRGGVTLWSFVKVYQQRKEREWNLSRMLPKQKVSDGAAPIAGEQTQPST